MRTRSLRRVRIARGSLVTFPLLASALLLVGCCCPSPRCCGSAPSPCGAVSPAGTAAAPPAAATPTAADAAAREARRAAAYADASASASQALDAIATMVAGLADAQGARARGTHVGLFEVGALAAARGGDVGGTTYFLESGRAGALLESLGAREALRRVVLPDVLRRSEAEAKARERAAQAAFDRALAGGDLSAARAARQDLRTAQDAVVDAVERSERAAKRDAAVAYPRALPLAEIQGELAAGDALVLFGVFSTESLAVVLTRDRARIVPLGKTADLVAACETLAGFGPTDASAAALAKLRALVVTPLAPPSDTRRLLVSPDGPLFRVPFAALVDALPIAYVPSGTTLHVLRASRPAPGRGVLALGDPDPSGLGASVAGRRFPPLPGARAEAAAVGDVVLVGREASEHALPGALAARPRWRALHFATPAVIDAARPPFSALVLAPDEHDDGFLRALEVFRTDVPADLVVLSACESAAGVGAPGEGLMGLPRAFLLAGAPRVVGALWKVDDAATAALMKAFYARWNPKDGTAGLPAAEALREAQASVRAQAKWKHPYYWAGWVLWGLPDAGGGP